MAAHLSIFAPQPLQVATLNTPITINEGDATYDGQDIVVSGTTATSNGPHSFNSLLLTNNAVLTHLPCTTATNHKLDLVVTNEILVGTNSRIDIREKFIRPVQPSPEIVHRQAAAFDDALERADGDGFAAVHGHDHLPSV